MSYSSFFSSGLLAPRTPPRANTVTLDSDLSDTWDDCSDYSPSQPSSPIPLPDDTLMDIDLSEVVLKIGGPAPDKNNTRRSVTPTPRSQQTTPVASPNKPLTSSREGRPRLRKRRSSLTQGTSPMHTIRSPTRAAGNAFNFQIHLPAVARARSGSLHGESMASSFAGGGMATEETSLIGRLRSGSCSNIHPQALNPPSRPVFRPRRIGRRILSMPIPAAAPPPTLPLPALPLLSPLELSTQHNVWLPNSNMSNTPFDFNANGAKSPQLSSARARGLSVSKSALDGEHNKIDEEMKEN